MYGVHIGLNNTPNHIHTVRTAFNKVSESDTSYCVNMIGNNPPVSLDSIYLCSLTRSVVDGFIGLIYQCISGFNGSNKPFSVDLTSKSYDLFTCIYCKIFLRILGYTMNIR